MSDAGSNERERIALRLFEESLDLPAEERLEFLTRRCSGDESLLASAKRLLAAESSGSAIEPLIAVPEPESLAGESRDATRRLGAWLLEDRIGAGGMGEVFRGRRSDGTFDRTVAIKRVLPGRCTAEVLARFERERRLLAALEHENIARLIDAGSDSDGIPYLVMEFVDGLRIDAYCDEHRLDLRARLKLFLDACDAVDHAHRHGVIHRDLKPGNILVTADGTLKLLDFGIAGVLDSTALPGEVTLTGESFGFMTPAYASPEQLMRAPLRAASDQYSLGVVLYEMLTGVLPHDLAALSPAEIERVVHDEDPPSPSVGVSRTRESATGPGAGGDPEARAALRGNTVVSLRRALRGDLDRIVMMALRKEPARRYAAVSDFAADLRRFLDGRPVRAHRDTVLYRATRFVQRNRMPVATAALVILAISAALVVALRALDDAEIAQLEAEAGLADADAVTDFLTAMLASGDPWEMGKDVRVREVLDRTAERVEADFGSRPLIAGRIHLTLGKAYLRLGEIEIAREHAGRARDLLFARLPEADPRVRESLWLLAMVHKAAKEYEPALSFIERDLEVTRRALGGDDLTVYDLINEVGGVLRADQRYDEAERRFREAIAGMERIEGPDGPHLAQAANNLGLLLMQVGRLEESRRWMERSARLHSMRFGEHHPESLVLHSNLGLLLSKEGRHAEACELLAPVAQRMVERLGPDHPQTRITHGHLSRSLFDAGRVEEARRIAHGDLEAARRVDGDRSLAAAEVALNLAEFELRLGDFGAAETHTYEAMVVFEALAPPEAHLRARSLRAHSVVARRRGDLGRAIALLEESVTLLRAHRPGDPDVARGYRDLGDLWLDAGRNDVALIWILAWLALAGEERAAASDRALRALGNAGAILHRIGRRGLAEECLLEAWIRGCERFGADDPRLIPPAEQLARFYARTDEKQSERWSQVAAALRGKAKGEKAASGDRDGAEARESVGGEARDG